MSCSIGPKKLPLKTEKVFNKVYESSASTFAINDQLKGSKWKRRSGLVNDQGLVLFAQ